MSKALVELIKSTEMSKAILGRQIGRVLDATSDEERLAAANRLRELIYAKLEDVEDIVGNAIQARRC